MLKSLLQTIRRYNWKNLICDSKRKDKVSKNKQEIWKTCMNDFKSFLNATKQNLSKYIQCNKMRSQ